VTPPWEHVSRRLDALTEGAVALEGPGAAGGAAVSVGARSSVRQVCTRCIMDTTAEGITFDERGQCSFCEVHDDLEMLYPLDGRGGARLERMLEGIRHRGRLRRYDCVVGVSGGRDSTYLLYLARRQWGLRPLAVHFNDGFDNPVAGENIKRAITRLGVDLRTITSDWRESKDIRIAFLKASTPGLEVGTDLGYFAALYGAAVRAGVKTIVTGHSFRTEGIAPLTWTYVDGRYVRSVQRRFGTVAMRPWRPDDPGFNLGLAHLLYYIVIRGIRAVTPMYCVNYVRREAEAIIREELEWQDPGAHYFDDLYQSLVWHVYRLKFGIDKRRFNYSALVRSGQMSREEALARVDDVYVIEDPKVIGLCIKRLGLTREQLDAFMALPRRTFRDYPNYMSVLSLLKPFIRAASRLNLVPMATYDKFFRCG
jgi:N-acetyl sugar amidotransferase